MAEKATVHKAVLQIADMDRHVYADFNLTLALHPSETLERMLVRLLAFCYRAEENLNFTRGLSSVDEPDLWLKHDDGRILNWIEVGQPMPDRLKKGSSQSEKVEVFTYGRGFDVWWKTHQAPIRALPKVSLYHFSAEALGEGVKLMTKTMNLSATITDGSLFLTDIKSGESASFELLPL